MHDARSSTLYLSIQCKATYPYPTRVHTLERWSFHSSDSQGFSYTLTLQLPMQRMGLPFAMCPPCVAMGKHAKKVLKYVLFTFRPIRLHFVIQLHVFSEAMNGVE